jgi:cyclophilin family peptidyl-prolyl cis-trans isomerase
MFSKMLLVTPLAGLLIAAAPAPVTPPVPSIVTPPEVAANPANRWTLQLSNGGTVVIQLRPDLAPHHIERIQTLVRRGFYDGLTFHRVVPGFMAQGGDPTGTGEGGSEMADLKAEFTPVPFLRGTVGAARTQQPDTANSQFFIMFAPDSTLDNNYTVIGRVISGMDAVDKIAPGEPPAEPTKIVRATLGG